ncbi:hypothetical protein M514_04347 [Trichuris suis]|uniref:Uncharacterized protein n=1 Tax=Trichuris suis TaxID=68888 RepID=A0A085N4N2_9BILA|nr:hypothetical protein M513_04347 [Trichuris suis]KFD64428.1 hypothetical protein M514_04347 [Trichuris suis]
MRLNVLHPFVGVLDVRGQQDQLLELSASLSERTSCSFITLFAKFLVKHSSCASRPIGGAREGPPAEHCLWQD